MYINWLRHLLWSKKYCPFAIPRVPEAQQQLDFRTEGVESPQAGGRGGTANGASPLERPLAAPPLSLAPSFPSRKASFAGVAAEDNCMERAREDGEGGSNLCHFCSGSSSKSSSSSSNSGACLSCGSGVGSASHGLQRPVIGNLLQAATI